MRAASYVARGEAQLTLPIVNELCANVDRRLLAGRYPSAIGSTRPDAVTQVSPKRTFRLPDFSGSEDFQHLRERNLFISMFRLSTEFGYSPCDWFSGEPSEKKARANGAVNPRLADMEKRSLHPMSWPSITFV